MSSRDKSAHGRLPLPWATIGFALLCLGLYVVFGGMPEMLVYGRSEIQDGEWWRLVTGHLVHLDLRHLAYNIGALLALGILYETASFGGSGRILALFGFGGAVVTAALYYGWPATTYYVGLSAVLNALYAATTISMWRETGNRLWLIVFSLNIAKIGWEAAAGPLFSGGLAWPPHIGAHIAGVTAGCSLVFWNMLRATATPRRLTIRSLRPTAPRPACRPVNSPAH